MINVKEIIEAKYMLEDIGRTVPDGAKAVLKGNYIFFLHPFKRFDPATLALIAVGAGKAIETKGKLDAGKRAEKIGKARAAIDIESAEAVKRSTVERARIKAERGRRLIEEQKGQFAASNIRIDVGLPLVIEAETRDIIVRDLGFILESGGEEESFFRSRAGLEIATGKNIKRKSKFDAISTGLSGFGSIAFLGIDK